MNERTLKDNSTCITLNDHSDITRQEAWNFVSQRKNMNDLLNMEATLSFLGGQHPGSSA